jgi:carboxyl-terminal processing protease
MLSRGRRLQVVLSGLVILSCLAYLGGQVFGNLPVNSDGRTGKTELSECHFLLKHSYVDQPDGHSLIMAAAKSLEEYLPDDERRTEAGASDLSNVSEEEALRRLESLILQASSGESPKIDAEAALYLALSGMVKSLDDPYTLAMDPKTYARFQKTLHSQPFGGVGLQLGRQDSQIMVFAVLPDTPAAKAGIRAGDMLVSVEQKDVSKLAVEEVEALLRGDPGSDVFCRFSRDGAEFSRTLVRVELKTRSVRGRLIQIPEGPAVGWLSVSSMRDSTGRELEEELGKFQQAPLDGLVLDLRDNVGGYVNAALEAASVFLESGLPVVTIKSRDGEDVRATLGGAPNTRPLIVLVNRRTASSAEILAACLQDYQRAKLVGERTFGKGSVQSLHEFESGGGLKYTTARYTSPRGRSIDGEGLVPDLVLEDLDVLAYCKEQWTRKK